MRKIAAKVICKTVTREVGSERVVLNAVTASTDENKTWSKFTPHAEISFTITNEQAFGAFVPGEEYLIEFTPATVH